MAAIMVVEVTTTLELEVAAAATTVTASSSLLIPVREDEETILVPAGVVILASVSDDADRGSTKDMIGEDRREPGDVLVLRAVEVCRVAVLL